MGDWEYDGGNVSVDNGDGVAESVVDNNDYMAPDPAGNDNASAGEAANDN